MARRRSTRGSTGAKKEKAAAAEPTPEPVAEPAPEAEPEAEPEATPETPAEAQGEPVAATTGERESRDMIRGTQRRKKGQEEFFSSSKATHNEKRSVVFSVLSLGLVFSLVFSLFLAFFLLCITFDFLAHLSLS